MSNPLDTLDEAITGQDEPMVMISKLELDTLKFTLDTLTNIMKDIDFKVNKVIRDHNDLVSDVNLMKSPLSAKKYLVK